MNFKVGDKLIVIIDSYRGTAWSVGDIIEIVEIITDRPEIKDWYKFKNLTKKSEYSLHTGFDYKKDILKFVPLTEISKIIYG